MLHIGMGKGWNRTCDEKTTPKKSGVAVKIPMWGETMVKRHRKDRDFAV